MEPLDVVGGWGVVAGVVYLLGKQAMELLAKRNGNGTDHNQSVISNLHESDQRLEHMQEELAEIRANMAQLLLMYHNVEMRIAAQEREAQRITTDVQILVATIRRT